MALTFEEYWPRWPEDTEGHLLLDICVKADVPELVKLLWSPDSFFMVFCTASVYHSCILSQAEANSQRNFLNIHSTDWVESETELPDLPGGFDWTYDRSTSNPLMTNIHGRMRKVRFESKGTVLAPQGFKTEEVQRCISLSDGQCIVDACVNSTAPFCENIRVLCRHIVEEIGSRKCKFSVSYHVVYLQSINMFVKSLLVKGVRDGLTSNYNVFSQTLGAYVPFAHAEGSVIAPSIADEDLETFTPPTYDLHSYQSAINWSRLPPVSLLISPLQKDGASSSLFAGWLLLEKIIKAITFCSILALAFRLVSCSIDAVAMSMQQSSPLLQAGPIDWLLTAFVILTVVEATQLTLYFGGHLLDRTRMGAIRLLNYINRLQLRSLSGRQPSLSSRGTIEREPSVIKRIFPEQGETEVDQLMSMAIDDKQGSTNLFRRAVDGFWTILDNSGVDFPKVTQPLSIDQRTNPDGSIVEEVFENERLQPFRGWGHSWPGHFLPTDRFNHWCSFDRGGDLVTSDVFQLVEPKLPSGWQWQKQQWEIDFSGTKTKAVDTLGWYYSLDFHWMKFIPEKNNGVKGISDFVRRRRWIRTRMQKTSISTKESVKDDSQQGSSSVPCFNILNFL